MKSCLLNYNAFSAADGLCRGGGTDRIQENRELLEWIFENSSQCSTEIITFKLPALKGG